MASWRDVAKRIRVPVGFAFSVVYLWLARPSWAAIAIGSGIVACGLGLRAYASGHVRKASELTTSGPYAHTRNPLYLGSLIMAAGFALAARSWWIALGMLAIFVLVYLPVIAGEEAFLRAQFADYEEYARRVPRLFPRLWAQHGNNGRFSLELYLRHREYNAAIGAAVMMAALIFKLVWFLPA